MPLRPAHRQRLLAPHDDLGNKAPETFGPLKGRDFGRVQQDLGAPAHLQQFTGVEIGKRHAGHGIGHQVAERVEEQVAGKVGNRQPAIGIEAHEAWLAAPVRHVDLPAFVVTIDIRRHEECVGTGNQRTRARVEGREPLRRDVGLYRGIAGELDRAQLDVTRTVAKAVHHGEMGKHPGGMTQHAIDAIAPPRGEVDAEHADHGAVFQPGIGRVGGFPRNSEVEPARVGRRQEARPTGAQRGPYPAVGRHRAQHDEWQLRIELAMLVGHVVANIAATDIVHFGEYARARLQGEFSGVPGRVGMMAPVAWRSWGVATVRS